MNAACTSPDCPADTEIFLVAGWYKFGPLYEDTYCLDHAIDYLTAALSELKYRRLERMRKQQALLDELSTPAPWPDAS